jgi:hypothetical protein
MSKRTTDKSAAKTPTPAPKRAKAASANIPAAPAPASTRRKAASPARPSEATDAGTPYEAPSAEDIATRAYFIAMERGFPGDPVSDWLQAEKQLRDATHS